VFLVKKMMNLGALLVDILKRPGFPVDKISYLFKPVENYEKWQKVDFEQDFLTANF
jgi:hypothetical protein